MENEIIIRSEDYKDGFRDSIIEVISILNDNSDITKQKLIHLLDTVARELKK